MTPSNNFYAPKIKRVGHPSLLLDLDSGMFLSRKSLLVSPVAKGNMKLKLFYSPYL